MGRPSPTLACGFCGVPVAGLTIAQTLCAYVLQFSTDMHRGDKVLSVTGPDGAYFNSYRDFSRVLYHRRYYFLPENPLTGARLYFINRYGTSRRSAASIAASVAAVEAARKAGESEITIKRLASQTGMKGYSHFLPLALQPEAVLEPELPVECWTFCHAVRAHASNIVQRRPDAVEAVFWRARCFGRHPQAQHNVQDSLRKN